MKTTRTSRPTVAAAIIFGMSAMWLGQGVASAVVRFARNSHKVDGFHAVGADASRSGRAGRLVATDGEGSCRPASSLAESMQTTLTALAANPVASSRRDARG